MIPLSVLTRITSPTCRMPCTILIGYPLLNFAISSAPTHILRVGLLIMLILLITGSLFQYFNPSHSRLDALFSRVMVVSSAGGCACPRIGDGSPLGGFGPPMVMCEMKPALRSVEEIAECSLV